MRGLLRRFLWSVIFVLAQPRSQVYKTEYCHVFGLVLDSPPMSLDTLKWVVCTKEMQISCHCHYFTNYPSIVVKSVLTKRNGSSCRSSVWVGLPLVCLEFSFKDLRHC